MTYTTMISNTSTSSDALIQQLPLTMLKHNNPTNLNADNASNLTLVIWLSIAVGLSVFGYLNPLHSPIGHDFLVNVFSFIVISFGISAILLKKGNALIFNYYSISIYTWLALIIVLFIQPFVSSIKYIDALIFPIASLILVTLVSMVTTRLLHNIEMKRQFLYYFSGWVYITLVLLFIIQIMQGLHYEMHLPNGLPVTRLSNFPNRLDSNLGQPNHAAYVFVLGVCMTIYQLSVTKNKSYQIILTFLFVIFNLGIFLTMSRTGILMVVIATLVYFISQPKSLKYKLSGCTAVIGVFIVSYIVGKSIITSLLGSPDDSFGAASRIVNEGVDSQRLALTYKAWLIFKDYPLTGVGWRNFSVGAFSHVDELKYVTFSDNSHMMFTQIGSELGILGLLCLLPIAWLLIRVCHMRHSPESAMALAFVMASLAYGCLEYPFWYFRFLVVFGLFLAMIEQKNVITRHLTQKANKIFGGIALVLTMASTYYMYQYWVNKYLFWYSHPGLASMQANGKLKSVFGFLNYNDMEVASVVDITPNMLPTKLALFNRVLVDEGSIYNLVSYGQLLSYDGKYDKALEIFKTACRMAETKDNCYRIQDTLNKSNESYPQQFKSTYVSYSEWLKSRDLK